jgi:hypothetical protein
VQGAPITPEQILAGRSYPNILFAFPTIDASKFPEIASFTVNKDYWKRKVVIEVKERERVIIWCLKQTSLPGTAQSTENQFASRCFWVDNTGLIFSDAPEPSGGGAVNIVHDATGRDLGINDYVLPPAEFVNLFSALNLLSKLQVRVLDVRIDNIKFRELTVVTGDGPKIYFSLLFDPDGDYDALKQIIRSADWKKFCYVDLRTQLRIYTSKSCLN